MEGFEPPTQRVRNARSTTELHRVGAPPENSTQAIVGWRTTGAQRRGMGMIHQTSLGTGRGMKVMSRP